MQAETRGPVAVVRRHPGMALTAGIMALAIGVGGFLWFRPDKLFTDTTVAESFVAPSGVIASGEFEGAAHPTAGTASFVETAAGRELRLEGFRTDNGPDLVVWLSEAPAGGDYRGSAFVDLGALKGNIGDQAYVIPDDVDLDRFSTAVIWCRRFTVAFGAASLTA